MVYDLGTWGQPHRVAEFRLVNGRAQLSELVPEGCALARQWHTAGVEILGEPQRVHPDDGISFMRALLQPFRMSYYRVIDESSPTPRD
ncbi:hypothetical protein AB0L82_39415 [Nocardia sp. NPDC052001]|uniref:hypothetical protein n=1 Tax=Nocardia sp. NPDC052001 TaxID=3154853 RepID=UPI003414EBFE